MDKKEYIFLSIASIAMCVIGLFLGYLLFHSEARTEAQETTKYVEIQSPKITIHDTIKLKNKAFRDSIYVPFEDSTRILKLMKERDSINLALIKFNVSENIKLDTIVEPTKDTVKMNYETLKKILDFEIRYSLRRDTVKSQTIYVPRNDFKTLALTGISGVVIGTILGLIIGK